MSERGPMHNGNYSYGSELPPAANDETQAIARPQQFGYRQGVPAVPLPPETYPEQEVERTRPIPRFDQANLPPGISTPLPAEAFAEAEQHGYQQSPWHDSITAVNKLALGNDETAEGVFSPDPNAPYIRPLGEKVIIALKRTVAAGVAVAAVVVLGLTAREISKLGQDHEDDRDNAFPAPTAPPLLPTPSLSSVSPSWSPSPSPSRTVMIYPAPTSIRPTPSKTIRLSPSASLSLSPSPSVSKTETATASPSPSDEINTCTPSGNAAETAICMPDGGTAYAYEWPPEQQKVVYSVQHGQVVRPECVNSSGWVLADYGDQAGYLKPDYFQQDDLRLIGQCAD